MSQARNCRGPQFDVHRDEWLTHLRDFGVCEKVDEQTALARFGVTRIDTNIMCLREEPLQVRSRIVARELQNDALGG